MSDLMTHGVLRMPPDMWGNDPLDIAQRHSRYVAASDRIYELERENEGLHERLKAIDAVQVPEEPEYLRDHRILTGGDDVLMQYIDTLRDLLKRESADRVRMAEAVCRLRGESDANEDLKRFVEYVDHTMNLSSGRVSEIIDFAQGQMKRAEAAKRQLAAIENDRICPLCDKMMEELK